MGKWTALIAFTLLVGTSLALVYQGVMIVIYGSILWHEPSAPVLGIEVAGVLAILLFALFHLVKILRRLKHGAN